MSKHLTSKELGKADNNLRELWQNPLFDNLHCIILITAAKDGKIMEVNQVAINAYGYDREEFMKLSICDLESKIKSKGLAKQMQGAYKQGILPETVHRRKDNSTFSVEVNSLRTIILGHKVIINTIRDISLRKQVQEELHLSEELFAKAFNSSPSPMSISTFPEGLCVKINEAYIRILGYSREELIGTRNQWGIWTSEEDLKRATEILKEKGVFLNLETKFRKKSGEMRTGLVSADRFNTGGQEYIMLIFNDITESKKAEEALIETEHFLNSVVENIPNMIFVKDAAELRFIRFNRAGEEMLGYKRVDLYGKNDHDLFPQKIADFYIEKDKEVLNSKQLLDIPEEYIDTKTNGLRIIHTKKIPILDDLGKPKYLLGISEDITERKWAEEKLQQTYVKLETVLEQTVKSLALLAEMRDPYSAGHEVRVANLATAIASQLLLPAEQIHAIRTASIIHDIGKSIIPASILSKPGKLTELEYSYIQTHVRASYEVVKDIEFSYPIAEIIYQHHERINGSGYPRGLAGEAILLGARILAVADVVEAMASHRPHRPALGVNLALKEISQNKDVLYDPEVVNACLKLFMEQDFII